MMRAIRLSVPAVLAAIFVLAAGGCAEMQNLRANSQAQARRIDELQRTQRQEAVRQGEELHRIQADLDKAREQLTLTQQQLRQAQTFRSEQELRLEHANAQAAKDLEDRAAELAQLRTALEKALRDSEALQKEADAQKKEVDGLQAKLKEKTDALAKAEADGKRLAGEREVLKDKLDEAQAGAKKSAEDLAEAKRQQAETAKTAAKPAAGGESDADLDEPYALLQATMEPLAKADLAFVTRDTRGVVVGLAADYVFEKGSIGVDAQCHPALDKIAEICAKYPKQYVEVQGHTDSQPITNLPFADNWSLASARADNVVRYLAEDAKVKIPASHLKSTSCSQYRPPEATTGGGKKLLRRVEIVLSGRP